MFVHGTTQRPAPQAADEILKVCLWSSLDQIENVTLRAEQGGAGIGRRRSKVPRVAGEYGGA
jgi:hypothetical protein